MKRFAFLYLVLLSAVTIKAQSVIQVFSPDKTIRADIKTSGDLNYSVFVDGKKILNESVIDMRLTDGRKLSGGMNGMTQETRYVKETIVAQIPYSRRNIPDEFN